MGTITEAYYYVFKDLADPRLHNWPLVAHPWAVLGITLVYLYSIYVWLPNYMANRKPYILKEIIQAYNIFQVVACSILMYGLILLEILLIIPIIPYKFPETKRIHFVVNKITIDTRIIATSGWTTHYSFGCQLVDYSEDKMAVRMAKYMWLVMFVKMAELLETVFFVLRKKYSQVSGLHVYHHASTFVLSWVCCKYWAGGMVSLTIVVNSFTHILMYTYYFLASLGPKMQSKLRPVKSKLTLFQMVQLCALFLHTVQVLLPSCPFPDAAAIIYLPNLGINIFLFMRFYVKSYFKKKTT